MTSWITRRPDRLDDDQAQQLKQILARCPALDRTAEHVRAFTGLMNDRRGGDLRQWMERVQGWSAVSVFVGPGCAVVCAGRWCGTLRASRGSDTPRGVPRPGVGESSR